MYNWIYRNILNKVDAERCHNIGLRVLKNRFLTKMLSGKVPVDDRLNVVIGGIKFDNPLGMAAGFDKNGIVFHNLMRLGFGHIEVGTITLDEREGNPKPRVWRTPDGLLNRMGLPGCGVRRTVYNISSKNNTSGIVGANISPISEWGASDSTIINHLHHILKRCVDYITLNVSCPNIDRNISKDVETIIKTMGELRSNYNIPIFIKLAPNITEDQLKHYLDLFMENNLDGVVLGNTLPKTIIIDKKETTAGLSGSKLIKYGIKNVSTAFQHTEGKLHIIGVGGISNANDVLEYIKCGASMVQIYTSFVKYGPKTPVRILNGILNDLDENQSIQDIRGTWS